MQAKEPDKMDTSNDEGSPAERRTDHNLPNISIADFQMISTARDKANTSLLLTLNELSNNFALSITELHDPSEQDAAQFLLAECFCKKGCLQMYCPGLTTEDFQAYIKHAWPMLKDLSFGLVDSQGRLVGVAALADAADGPALSEFTRHKDIHPHVANVYEYLDGLISRVEEHLPSYEKRGVVLDKFLLGVALNIMSASENLYVMYRIVKETHKRAEARGYQYSVAQNAHPYTQQLAQFFNCKRLLVDHPRHFVNKKNQEVFSSVPEKMTVTVDLRTYPS